MAKWKKYSPTNGLWKQKKDKWEHEMRPDKELKDCINVYAGNEVCNITPHFYVNIAVSHLRFLESDLYIHSLLTQSMLF